jgi:F-type H+-transporting ATPase subunit b
MTPLVQENTEVTPIDAHAEETLATTAVAHETETAPTGLASLGINGTLLLAQLINVAIVLFILQRWVFKPLAKILEARRVKIEDGLKNAKEAEEKLKRAEETEDAMMAAARKEARGIVEESRAAGEKVRNEQVAEAKRDIDAQTEEAKAKIQTERAHALEAVRKEVATLVMTATRKVSSTELDEKAHRAAVEDAMKDLENA